MLKDVFELESHYFRYLTFSLSVNAHLHPEIEKNSIKYNTHKLKLSERLVQDYYKSSLNAALLIDLFWHIYINHSMYCIRITVHLLEVKRASSKVQAMSLKLRSYIPSSRIICFIFLKILLLSYLHSKCCMIFCPSMKIRTKAFLLLICSDKSGLIALLLEQSCNYTLLLILQKVICYAQNSKCCNGCMCFVWQQYHCESRRAIKF
ncbi:hypothetical protein EDC96DRAFT_562437 [Choanephora cucurbitarum]|nr:hypothetical protein EDC96DRAFT_562437 [Choanephora cucurbitarum]